MGRGYQPLLVFSGCTFMVLKQGLCLKTRWHVAELSVINQILSHATNCVFRILAAIQYGMDNEDILLKSIINCERKAFLKEPEFSKVDAMNASKNLQRIDIGKKSI